MPFSTTPEVRVSLLDYMEYVEDVLVRITGRFPEKTSESGLRKIAFAAQPAVLVRDKFVETFGGVDTILIKGLGSFSVHEEFIPKQHYDINKGQVVPTVLRKPAFKLNFHPSKKSRVTPDGDFEQ